MGEDNQCPLQASTCTHTHKIKLHILISIYFFLDRTRFISHNYILFLVSCKNLVLQVKIEMHIDVEVMKLVFLGSLCSHSFLSL